MELPESTVSFCRQRQLPLFILPWEISISSVLQDCCNAILLEQQKTGHLQRFYGAALFETGLAQNPTVIPEYVKSSVPGNYQLYAFDHTQVPPALAGKLEAFFSKKDFQIFCYSRNEKSYYLIHFPASMDAPDPDELTAYLDNDKLSLGISTVCSSPWKLFQKRIEAEKAMRTANAVHTAYYRYEDLGLYDIILSINDREVLRNLYEKTLKPLAEHDALHGTNYLEILRLYIRHNSSIQAVAEITGTHRNTIDYRIQRIRQIMTADFTTMQDRCFLKLAFCIHDLYAGGESMG